MASGFLGAILAGSTMYLLIPTPPHAPGLVHYQEQAPVSAPETGRWPASLPEQPKEHIVVNWPTGVLDAEATAAYLQSPIDDPGDTRAEPERIAQADEERQVPQMRDRDVAPPQTPQPVEQETQVPGTPGPREAVAVIAAPQAQQIPNAIRAPVVKNAEEKRSPAEVERKPRRSTRAAASSAGATPEEALGFASEQIENLYRRAMRGSPKAEFELAQRYADGHGVPEDSGEAMRWFLRAAEHGSTGAQVNIGLMYAYGYGVEQDYVEAMKWFQRAAARGNADALFNIGTLYKDGLGVPQDLDEAAKWYHRAASRGVEGADAPSPRR
jgi:hypothetical protein